MNATLTNAGRSCLHALVTQGICHYYCIIVMAALLMIVVIPPLYENLGFVIYVVIRAFVLTNVTLFLALGPTLKQHWIKHKIVKR